MIVLEAGVLIAHLDAADAQHARATDVLIENAGESLACSVVTLAEVLVGPARLGLRERVTAALEELGVSVLGLDPGDAERLARMRASTGLKLPDCCVLVAAELSGAGLATFDDRLRRSAQERGARLAC